MRRLLLAATSVLFLVTGFASSSDATERTRFGNQTATVVQARFCLQGRIWGYPGNCQFSTYEQCIATASGTNAYCGENPMYLFRQQRWPAR